MTGPVAEAPGSAAEPTGAAEVPVEPPQEQPSSSRPRWELAAAYAPLVVGAWAWTWPASRIPLEEVGDTGVVAVLPVWCWLGLALVLVGTVRAVWGRTLSDRRVAVHVVVLVVLLYGAVIASSPFPRGTVPWRHVGIAAQIGATGEVDPGIDAYFGWPGFFGLLASWSGMSGLPDASVLMKWAPVATNLLLLLPLLLLARALVPDRRRAWSGIVVFYLANWVDQDYLAPQALGFFLYVCVMAAVLTLLPAPERLADRLRLAVQPPTGRVEAPARLLVAVVVVVAAVVTTHQLTPFALLLGFAALAVLRSTSVRGLVLVTGALILCWMAYAATTYLDGHLGKLLSQVGDVAGAARGGLVERAQGSDGHLFVVRARIVFSALVWGLGLVGAVHMLRRRQLRGAAAALVVAPGLLFPLQSYGGEMLLRIFLFSLPFTALLAAQVLPGPETAGSRRRAGALMLALALLLTPGFVLVRYGNQVIDQRGVAEVEAVRALYALAPPGSPLYAGNTSTPWRNLEYADHKHRTLADLADRRPPEEVAAVVDLLRDELLSGEATGLVLLTRQQEEYERLVGRRTPWTLAQVREELLTRSDFTVVFRNADALVLRPKTVFGPYGPAGTA